MKTHEVVQHTFRSLITAAASRVGLTHEIEELSDVEAVRAIQLREGYTDCFGRDIPLIPNENGSCGEFNCAWRNLCEAYRGSNPPVDKLLSSLSKADVVAFRNRLLGNSLGGTREGSGDALQYSEFVFPVPAKPITTGNKQLGMTVRSLTSLNALTKKLVLGSPSTVICESPRDVRDLKTYLLMHQMRHFWPTPGGCNVTYHLDRVYLHTTDVELLSNWTRESEPLLNDGTVSYQPHLSYIHEPIEVWRLDRSVSSPYEKYPASQPLSIRSFETPHIGRVDGEFSFTEPDIVPLMNIELPVLEGVSIQQLHRILSENTDAHQHFRLWLSTQTEKMRSLVVTSETFDSDIRVIQREVNDQSRMLKSKLQQAKIKSTLDVVGASLAAFTLSLYCIITGETECLKFLGPGGAVYYLSKSVGDRVIADLGLKDNPVYLLWLIGQKSK